MITIIGTGTIAQEYAKILNSLDTKYIVVGNRVPRSSTTHKNFQCNILYGGIANNLTKIVDRGYAQKVIICVPIEKLFNITNLCIQFGITNILVEKPGFLSDAEIRRWNGSNYFNNGTIYLALNRLFYPSVCKLKKIIQKDSLGSAHLEIGELLNKISLEKFDRNVLKHWGWSNTIHSIATFFHLIGLPKKINTISNGEGIIPWHKNKSIFCGSGITNKNIPFTYNSNWNSVNRWGMSVYLKDKAYHLRPLENLYEQTDPLSLNYKCITYQDEPSFKPGFYDMVKNFLSGNKENFLSGQAIYETFIATKKIFDY